MGSGIVAALPGDGGWKNKNNGWGEELKTECATSSTCKAQYTTYHETQEKPYTQTVTETVYKPSVIHTQEHSAYPTTSMSPRKSRSRPVRSVRPRLLARPRPWEDMVERAAGVVRAGVARAITRR